MNLKEFREKFTTKIEENPQLSSEISETHECELAYESVIELIEEQNNEK